VLLWQDFEGPFVGCSNLEWEMSTVSLTYSITNPPTLCLDSVKSIENIRSQVLGLGSSLETPASKSANTKIYGKDYRYIEALSVVQCMGNTQSNESCPEA